MVAGFPETEESKIRTKKKSGAEKTTIIIMQQQLTYLRIVRK